MSLLVKEIHEVKGNIVNNIVISSHGDRWLLDLCDHIVRYINVESLYSIPKTDIIFVLTLFKFKKKKTLKNKYSTALV